MLAEMRVRVWPEPGRPAALHGASHDGAAPPARGPLPGTAPQQLRPPAVAPVGPATPTAPEPVVVAMPVVADAAIGIENMDWPALADAVRSCQACGLCAGRKAAVFADDQPPAQADWLVVGEPPDEQEERAGSPFAGPAGQLLDNMLRAVQCQRDGQGQAAARLTNVVKCRPAVARNPQREELTQCGAYLRREIALTRPRVILAMGRFAAWSLLAQDYPQELQMPFGQLRGRVFRTQGIPVVVMYHPAKLLRAPLEKANAWADLCLARSLVLQPGAAA